MHSAKLTARLTIAGALCGALLLGVTLGAPHSSAVAQRNSASPLTVDAQVALHSLMSLGDMHLRNTANVLTLLATTDAARSADWERIRGPLSEAAELTAPGARWFALPDGSYWTVAEGRATVNLSDRPYFARVLAGQTVVGDLVVSRATRKSTAIVAVPVRGPEGAIVGVLGSSIFLDQLSEQIRREMHLDPHHLFYSLDAEPVVGLHADPETIFLHPLEEGDPALERAIREILSRESGTTTYFFRGRQRTVVYRKSPVTGWWYAFGVLNRGRRVPAN
jgi:hypothetical protein